MMSLLMSLLMGLEETQVAPAVEVLAGEPVVNYRIEGSEHTVQGYTGYCSQKNILTVTYLTASGRAGSADVFVKRINWAGPSEAGHYEYLSEWGAPVTHLYGAVLDAQGHEVLFLEHLPRIGVDGEDTSQLREFVRALACFNATPITTEYAQRLPRHAPAEYLTGGGAVRAVTRVLDHAERGELGGEIASLSRRARPRLPDLSRFAHNLGEHISGMASGLLHEDYASQNVGWREDGTLAIFDLHKTCLGPRFVDAARVLGAPDDAVSYGGEPKPPALPRTEAARLYLTEWARRQGQAVGGDTSPSVPFDAFFAEVDSLWAAGLFSLGWHTDRALDGRVDWTDDVEEGQRVYSGWLHGKLDQLLLALERYEAGGAL